MKHLRWFTALALVAIFSACCQPHRVMVVDERTNAPPAPAVPYAVTEIDPTTYSVSFYSESSSAAATAGLLITCEYLAGVKGADYLVVLTQPQVFDSRTSSQETTTSGKSHGAAFGNGYGGAYGVGHYKGSSNTTTTTYDHFQASVTIRLLHGPMPADNPSAYPAKRDAPSAAPASTPAPSPDIWQ